jgi:transposase
VRIEGSAADVVLGLDGFVVQAAHEVEGELWLAVETAADFVGCSGCGTRARSKGRPATVVRDMACGGRPVRLVWRKRRWYCPDPDCDTKTWTEKTGAVRPRAGLTERARLDICTRVGRDAASVLALAREYGVAWSTAMAAVVAVGTPLVEDPDRIGVVHQLGIDETSFLAANAAHPTTYVTGLVDLQRGRLLDVVDGNRGADLARWLGERPEAWRAGVQVVATDPHEGYRRGISPALDHATLVADPFHIAALANRAVDEVRRRVQQGTLGHRGRKEDPLYRIRRVLVTGGERLSERGWERLQAGLVAGDPDDEVLESWLAKEHVRDIYLTADATEAAALVDKAIGFCADSAVEEVRRLGRTLTRWRSEILAHHRTGASNGPTEALNLLIKKVKRVGHGHRRFANYRLRLLLHCGVAWPPPPAAVLRPHPRRRRLAA